MLSVDEFALLRGRLYEAHGAFGTAASALATQGLFTALLDGDVQSDPLLAEVMAARLAADGTQTPDRGALLGRIARLGQDPYLDRYLTDALQGALPAVGAVEISERLADLADLAVGDTRQAARAGSRRSAPPFARQAAALATAAELGLAPFAEELVLPLLGHGDSGLRAAAAHYAAAARIPKAVGALLAAAPVKAGPCGDRGLELAASAVAVAQACRADPTDAACEAERRLGRPGLADELRYAALDSELPGPALVQTMFYGDPARPGRGNSGGTATLVRHLGDALAAGGRPVLTVVPYDTATAAYPYRAVERLAAGHILARLPLYLPGENALGFLRSHGRVRLALRRLLRLSGVRPGVLHVRFLDDASLAAAREAEREGVPLVTTLTPDPHRSLCDPSGRLQPLAPARGLEALNKIWIGDELLRRSRGIVGIGRRAVREQLLPYFPQLENAGERLVTDIDEGIRLEVAPAGLDVPALLSNPALELGLAAPAAGRPVMLNVGRLSPLKGQLNLLRAWLDRRWWRTHDLVLIGGDFRHPAPGEAEILGAIRRLAGSRPNSRGNLAHLEALPNPQVREVESFLGSRSLAPFPDLYVCSSYKEEFGLSILEAMAAGMVVCAPLRGGARRYLRHGVNGFLVDTTSAASLARDLEALLGPLAVERVRALQENARETVRRDYSIQRVAEDFESLYGRVLGGG
ncbi:MAG: glycosyltransferase family 4 protein [Spirochaetales bacterium]|nr:glycosyltransferase family 4 protein [Spirochaetales bacterium]